MGKIIIDCDATPFRRQDWEIRPDDQIQGAVGGQLEFDPAKVLLHLVEGQKDGKVAHGYDLMEELAGKPLLKANVLERLLANTDLIPEAWKTDEQGPARYIYFWGTVYRHARGYLIVRYLCWDDGSWGEGYVCIKRLFDGQGPAAVLVS